MFKTGVIAAAISLTLGVAPAMAQRAEVGITGGWTFSDGVTTESPIIAGNGQIYDRVDPKDSFSWGFNIGIPVGTNLEVGFLLGQQMSKLVADGTTQTEVGDMTVNTYHGYVGYNFGEATAGIRPYLFFGLGATSFSDVDYTRRAGGTGTVQGLTNFSTTWGAGVKGYASDHLGWKAGLRFTPTYMRTDAEGWWCDPYWGCYVVGDAQYSNQFEFNGGVIIRF